MAAATVVAPTSTDLKKAYDTVAAKLKEQSALSGVASLLDWDQMVMMPAGGSESRGAQKSALAGVLHDKRTDAELGTLLRQLKEGLEAGAPGADGLDAHARAVVRDAYKDYARTVAIPKALAQRCAALETEAYTAWVEARKASDWSKFAPYLQQWVDINLEKAKHINPAADPYDVLLEDFEKGMTAARLDEIFAEVRAGLVPLIAAIKAKGAAAISDACVRGSFDIDTQAKLCKQVSTDLGFGFENGRQDVSVHPFMCAPHPTDVRMTTRFKPDDVLEGLTGAIHETGHALYEQGRDLTHDGLPVSQALSMGLHESQSLLWERMVALSRPFATYLVPRLKEFFPAAFSDVSADALYAAANVVKDPSYIRVESDEVTYPMHIILRYEIERGLLAGTIKVADVPAVWADKMREYLGVTPPDDAKGCLQDMHWSAGVFGYFPTYSLGAMYATQIYQAAARAIPGLEGQVAAGDFKALKAWLNEHIHKLGSLHPSGDELMMAATGSKLQPSIFLDYLRAKYGALYGL
eukprot:CAMPEP_0202858268 /NCGR_PEP_ID=MMETSP1391-20130828/873_1 /ASSEMBLY_ACC=CAM_ASM_000867 /TAXON_ID=1034604 /ORGANISM="Chlamydomonas leiostraca, Strain SAG 11-49" /LENGTH=522 /DNA_ID=CAMNT_0049537167 /DNA_START=116 /DNA_END=1684 /DNA_ORIENTATION=-